MPPRLKPWKTRKSVSKLHITKPRGRCVQIGSGSGGRVFVGRIEFKDGSRHRVAIKIFHSMVSDKLAKHYDQTIHDLRKAGVKLPKMGMYKMNGRWVQVSQLFGSVKQGSKLGVGLKKRFVDRIETAEIFTKVFNAGYNAFYDTIDSFKRPKGVLPIDIDLIVQSGKSKKQMPERVEVLASQLKKISENFSPQEVSSIYNTALETINPNWRSELASKLKSKKVNPIDTTRVE